MSPSTGTLSSLVLNRVPHQAADHDRLLVANHHLRARRASVDRNDAQGPRGRALLGDLLFDFEANLVVRVDVWDDSNPRADVLTRHAPEPTGETGQVAEVLPPLCGETERAEDCRRRRTCRARRRWSGAECSHLR